MNKKVKEEYSDVLKKLNALFGDGVMQSSDTMGYDVVVERASTGSYSLDKATGGGLPKNGRSTCIIGPESSSKSTISLSAIANEHKKGNLCCLFDIEGSYDENYSKTVGVIPNLLHMPDHKKLLKSLGIKESDRTVVAAEEWFDLLIKTINSNIYSLVVLDSVTALQPMIEIQNGVANAKIGSIATPMTKAYRGIANALKNCDGGFVYITQYRMSPGKYGDPRIESGAEAWKYLQDLKIALQPSLDKEDGEIPGIVVKGKVSKSKVCIPHKTFEYYIEFGKGIIRSYELIKEAISAEVITKTGNTYFFLGEKIGVGEKQLNNFFETNLEELEKLEIELNKLKIETIIDEETEKSLDAIEELLEKEELETE
mgnify:CR=1 FL=1